MVGIAVVRNESDLLPFSILHHHQIGVQRFLVLDHGSSDGTNHVLAELSRRVPVSWSRDVGPYQPARFRTDLARQAHAEGADWIVPFDADEFWWTSRDLRSVLARSKSSVLRCEVVNFVQGRQETRPSVRSLASMTRRVQKPAGRPEDAEKLVEMGQVGFVEMAYPSKVIFKASDRISVDPGHHSVAGSTGPLEDRDDIACLHAPLRARSLLEEKASRGRTVIERGFTGSEGWHIRRWARLEDEGSLEREWEANSYRDGALDVWGERHALIEDERLAGIAHRLLPQVLEIRERAGLRD